MTGRLRLLFLAILWGVASLRRGDAHAEELKVTFNSSTYTDMRQILARDKAGDDVAIEAQLGFPDVLREVYPAVIVVHGLGGYRETDEGYVAAALRRAGFATLTYDSFASRGTTGAALQGTPGYLPIGVADAFAALRFLSAQRHVDPNRVAIVGFSYGGEIAHLTAFERLRSALVAGTGRFAAHVPFYPGGTFGVEAAPHAYTGAPILMLLGAKDDNLPASKIQSYLTYERAAGAPAPIETITYPNAYHAWTVAELGPPRFYRDYVSTKSCPFILIASDRPKLLIDGQAKPFDAATLGACVAQSPGYAMGFDEDVREQSIADMIGFLKDRLGRQGP